MDTPRIIYICIMSICLAFALHSSKHESMLKIFVYLLGLSLITEILAQVMVAFKLNSNMVYHIYVPLEYSLWAGYFYWTSHTKKIKKIIGWTIPLFIVISIIISVKIVTLKKFPTLQLNIEGILLVIWAVIAIFNIKIQQDKVIFSLPGFWICTGVLIYYTSTASFMGVYNFISDKNAELLLVLKLHLLIVPNYILYTCLSIAFICSRRIRK